MVDISMAQLKLLSNGKYHVVLMPSGSGRSGWNDLAVTRWKEDATLDRWGSFLLLRGDPDASVWSAFDTAAFAQRGLRASLEVAVAADADIELRRLRITNVSHAASAFSATSYAELVLAAAATDSAHPAFNKLFIVTEIEAQPGAILATRRPSGPSDPTPWLFHQAVAQGETGALSFETDRMHFIGRGLDVASAAAMRVGGPLGCHVGPVLDPIASVRVPLRLADRKSVV